MMIPSVWPWYLPPATLLGLVAVARGIVTLSDAAMRRAGKIPIRRLHPAAATVLVVLIVGQLRLCGWNAIHTQIHQSEIEMGNRYPLGMWLHDHGRPEESVYLKPSGYVGYFSGMRMIDWPGLVAPQVIKAQQAWAKATEHDLRPASGLGRAAAKGIYGPGRLVEKFEKEYELAAVFDVTERLQAYGYRPSLLYHDARFGVFRRRDLRPADFKS